METIVIAILLVYLIVGGVGMYKGLDLSKWSSWIYGIYGFLSGFLIGFLIVDLQSGLLVGALFAFIVMYSGVMIRWHRQRFK